MDSKIAFLTAAISDTQATIRAIDVKIAAALVVVLAPIQNLHRVFSHLSHFSQHSPHWFFIAVAGVFLITWLLAVAAFLRAVSAIDSPANHIINARNCKGSFYAGGMYPLTLADAFFNRDIIKASKDPTSFAADLPNSHSEIELELVFEQMKLAYIRDIKLKRLHWGLRFAEIWMGVGVSIYLLSKYSIVASF